MSHPCQFLVRTSYNSQSRQKQPPRQFQKYLFFFSRSNLFIIFQEGSFVPRTDMNFPGGSICSSNRHEFSRRVYMFFEQTQIFQEGLSKRHVFSRMFYLFIEQTFLSNRTDTNFPRNPYLVLEHIRIFQGASFLSSNRYSFSRKPYLVLEHIRFSRRPYLVLEHIQFSRSPYASNT